MWNRRGIYFSAVLFLSCGTATRCVTQCGMSTIDTTWTCEEFQDVETRTMEEFKKTTTDPRLHSCRALEGYWVGVDEAETFYSGSIEVRGVCHCDTKFIRVGKPKELPYKSALAHEMAHALQYCLPLPPFAEGHEKDVQKYFHSNWDRDGIKQAINNLYNQKRE